MPVRNRLLELQKNANITQKDIEAQNMPGSEDGIPMEPLLKNMSEDSKRFFEKIEEIKDNIDTISDNAKNIKHLHAKILYQANPDPTHQERLDDLAAENLRLGAQVGKALSAEHDKLDTAIQAASGGAKSQKLGVEMRMRKVQLSTNTQRFKEVIGKFHAEMDEFKNNEKEKVSKRIRTVYPEYNDDEVQKMVESDKVEGNLFSKGYLQETEKAKRQLTELEDRLEEFKKLERSLVELNKLFLEMAALVQQQGEMVDNIAIQVEEAAERTKEGNTQLDKAAKLKIQGRKLKLIIAAVVAVLLLVLLLVILSEFGAFSGSDTRTVIVEKTIIQYVTDNKTVTSTAPVNPPSSPVPSTSQPPPAAEVETTTELVELKP